MPMVTKQNVTLLLDEIVGKCDSSNQNKLHGLLLILSRLVKDRYDVLKVPLGDASLAHHLLELLLGKLWIATQ